MLKINDYFGLWLHSFEMQILWFYGTGIEHVILNERLWFFEEFSWRTMWQTCQSGLPLFHWCEAKLEAHPSSRCFCWKMSAVHEMVTNEFMMIMIDDESDWIGLYAWLTHWVTSLDWWVHQDCDGWNFWWADKATVITANCLLILLSQSQPIIIIVWFFHYLLWLRIEWKCLEFACSMWPEVWSKV